MGYDARGVTVVRPSFVSARALRSSSLVEYCSIAMLYVPYEESWPVTSCVLCLFYTKCMVGCAEVILYSLCDSFGLAAAMLYMFSHKNKWLNEVVNHEQMCCMHVGLISQWHTVHCHFCSLIYFCLDEHSCQAV